MISVKLSEFAQKQIKELRKRFHSISDDILNLISEVEIDPKSGIGLGGNLYKKGLQSAAKQKVKVVRVGLFISYINLIQKKKLLLLRFLISRTKKIFLLPDLKS